MNPKADDQKEHLWAKEQQQLKNALNKDRAIRLEGSFGNHKNHYGLGKVKARNEVNEILWIYFGVFTANSMQIANQRQKKQQLTHNPIYQAA